MRRGFVAADAVQLDAESGGASFWRGNPWAYLPRRIVANVLAVPALQLGQPMPFVILVKSNDRLIHVVIPSGAPQAQSRGIAPDPIEG